MNNNLLANIIKLDESNISATSIMCFPYITQQKKFSIKKENIKIFKIFMPKIKICNDFEYIINDEYFIEVYSYNIDVLIKKILNNKINISEINEKNIVFDKTEFICKTLIKTINDINKIKIPVSKIRLKKLKFEIISSLENCNYYLTAFAEKKNFKILHYLNTAYILIADYYLEKKNSISNIEYSKKSAASFIKKNNKQLYNSFEKYLITKSAKEKYDILLSAFNSI